MGCRTKPGADLAEIESIYTARLREFQRVATAITGNRDLGCEAVQDGFAQAVHKRAEFRAEGALAGWLWQIVVSASHDARRRGRVRADPAHYEDQFGNDDVAESADHLYVRAVVARLPDRRRLALFLRYYADLDYSAIAEVLGIAPGTVAATLHQAHLKLRDLMG